MATAQTITRPTFDEIRDKIFIYELLLGDHGMDYTVIPATATEPEEHAGILVEYNAATNEIEFATDHETLKRFAFDTPYDDVRRWIQCREDESLVF